MGCWGDFTTNGVCVKCGISNTQQVKPRCVEACRVPSWTRVVVFGASSDPLEVGTRLHVLGAPWAPTARLLLDFRGKWPVWGRQMGSGVAPCSHPQYLCVSVPFLPLSLSRAPTPVQGLMLQAAEKGARFLNIGSFRRSRSGTQTPQRPGSRLFTNSVATH